MSMTGTAVAEHDGVSISFEVVGSGSDTLLMLPGLGLPGRGFGPLIDLLAADRRVIVVDPRGSGASSVPDAPYTPQLVAGDARAVLDAAGIEQADVLGLSMGGCIAQQLAIRHPERVRSLILLSTLARPDDWFTRLIGFRRLLTEQLGLARQLDLALCLLLSPQTFAERPDLVARLEGTMQKSAPSETAYLRQLDYVLAHDAQDALAAVQVPALVVTGERDLLTPPTLARPLAAALPNARLVLSEQGSHGLWIEQPDWLADLVGGFLAELA
jgi:pimeloyl-ACP methyl ester carboxylesterase